jgi:hypothetical protein
MTETLTIETEKHKQSFNLEINSIADQGEGKIRFNKPQVITDGTEQRNGTRYDIATMDMSEYDGTITANHSANIQDIVGKTIGLRKRAGKVTIDGIDFAVKQSALAGFGYEMMKAGYISDLSIETYGPFPDEEGIYRNAKLVGLSIVVTGNNKSARVNSIVKNSIEEARKIGLDTQSIENIYSKENLSNKTEEKMAIEKVKNAEGEEVKEAPAPEAPVVEKKEEVVVETPKVETPKEESKVEVTKTEESLDKKFVELNNQIKNLEQKLFDNSAKEPEFKKSNNTMKSVINEYSGMNWRDRSALQINSAWDMLKKNSSEAAKKLEDINKFHLEELQKSNRVDNAMTIADFGNFVISPELLTTIEGYRSDFTPLVSRLDYRETNSTQMAWLKRSGDINMTSVEMCDDGANGNLKDISDYSATQHTANLEELAAVTPVCNAVTRFLAADMIGDIAQGYRTDYDRKKAQLFIARLEQAVEETGNEVTYNKASNTTAVQSWIQTWVVAQQEIMNGVFIFNQKTYGELLLSALGAGINGPLAGLFTTGDQPLIAGSPFIVVPNELLPSLNTNETKAFVVNGTTVTVNHAVFYVDLSTFTGRTSGGLQYDLSTEAAYEESGTVKSAFQRNELVLRGSMFRGGAVKDSAKVAALMGVGVS